MKSAYLSLIFILFAAAALCAQEKESYRIGLQGNVRQGSILFVTLKNASQQTEAQLSFRGKTSKMIWNGQNLAGTVPVALDCPKGVHTLSVTVEGPQPLRLERAVNTTEHTYGTQQLWLSQSQLETYDDPQADRDNDAIKKAIGQDAGEILWEKNFIWPTPGRTSTLFGLKRFYNDDPEPEFHRGIDIAAPSGQIVKAAQNGVVRFVGRDLKLHGDTAVISHGQGVSTLYIHMNSVSVKEGQTVRQGDPIGTVGSKGVSTGPHLHWAAYSQGEPVDPKLLMQLPAGWLSVP